VVVVVAVVVAVALAGAALLVSRSDDEPPDGSPGAELGVPGLEVLGQLLRSFGAEVRVGTAPGPRDDVALVLPGYELSEGQEGLLNAWVRSGGVAVRPGTSPIGSIPGITDELERGDCAIAALDEVDTIVRSGSDGLIAGDGCFRPPERPPSGGAVPVLRSFVTEQPVGDGSLVELGGIGPFTDDFIAEADNAVLATSLLAPTPGTSVVVVVPEGEPGAGGGAGSGSGGGSGGGGGSGSGGGSQGGSGGGTDPGSGGGEPGSGGGSGGSGDTPRPVESDPDTLIDSIPLGVRLAIVQALIALALFVAWRARRLGRPRDEPVPVPIESSELVGAVGSLLERTGDATAAAAMLRSDLHRQLAARFGLPEQTPTEQLVVLAAARAGVAEARLRIVLEDRPVADAGELVSLSRTIDAVRLEVLRDVPV
jgi:hypothetical protein